MSWEKFRENVMNVVSKPENINNIDLVEETYAKEYDACIRRGGDVLNKIPIEKGNTELMKTLFKAALQTGLTKTTPYDLVGEMGKGVIAYWTGAQMRKLPIPLVTIDQISAGATQNIAVISNTVINPGRWRKASSPPTEPPKRDPNKPKVDLTKTTADPMQDNENVLFVGDSITAPSYAYPYIIAKLKPNIKVDVLALGAKQTKWMLENLPTQLSLKQYDRVYIYGGINDMFSQINIDKAISNVQKMVDLCISNGATPYIIIGYDPDTDMDYRKMPLTIYLTNKAEYIPMIAKYKEYQTKLPTSIKNAKFVGVFNIGVLGDGFHPSSAQYRKIAKIIIDGN